MPWSLGTAGSASFSSREEVGLLELQTLLASPLLCLSESSGVRDTLLRGGLLGRWCRMGEEVKLRQSSTEEHLEDRLLPESTFDLILHSSTARRPNSGLRMLDTEKRSGRSGSAGSTRRGWWSPGLEGRRRAALLACRAKVEG